MFFYTTSACCDQCCNSAYSQWHMLACHAELDTKNRKCLQAHPASSMQRTCFRERLLVELCWHPHLQAPRMQLLTAVMVPVLQH
jgi:hypothetical protein